jgi:hypothetical protein
VHGCKRKCRFIEQQDWDDTNRKCGIKALPNWHGVADVRAGYADLQHGNLA